MHLELRVPAPGAPAGSLGTMTMNIYHCSVNEGTVDL